MHFCVCVCVCVLVYTQSELMSVRAHVCVCVSVDIMNINSNQFMYCLNLFRCAHFMHPFLVMLNLHAVRILYCLSAGQMFALLITVRPGTSPPTACMVPKWNDNQHISTAKNQISI